MDVYLIIGLAVISVAQLLTLYFLNQVLDVRKNISLLRVELTTQFKNTKEEVISSINLLLQNQNSNQKDQLDSFSKQLTNLTQINESKLESIRTVVADSLFRMQTENNDKLEKMRATVEEKLHDTLEKRLGDSFKIVSERLELVHKGLGEMQSLASGVGDLKKVLTNVKTRGTWGEVQLDALIEQILAFDQYEKNCAVIPNSSDRVEFAIKIPNKDDLNTSTLLPIDAKFPLEDYQRLVAAYDIGDPVEIEMVAKQLESTIKKVAKLISEKYIHPPYTTDFAIMFLPVEALYAEVLRKPGIIEFLQREYRVVITSPTTLLAILNSLQMGFRAIVIEKRSSEVWKVLSSVKSEFVKFADVLAKTKTKLDQASKVIGDAETRTRVIQRHLKRVETAALTTNDNLEALEDTQKPAA